MHSVQYLYIEEKKKVEKYKSLIKKASRFVEKQKGVWDNSKWQAFLSDTEKKGVAMNAEMRHYLGLLTESMKKFYEHTKDTGKKMTGTVSDQVAKFVVKTKGKWEHLDWEKFVKDIQQKGTDITENNRAHLGGILESAKKLYHALSMTIQREEKEAEITQELEVPEAPSKPKARTARKPAGKQVRKATTPKKEGTPPKTKPAKKVQPKKSKGTMTTKTFKAASPKKEGTEKPAAKGKETTTVVKTTPPKKQATRKTAITKPATKGTVKARVAPAGKKK
jgi:hypothetical protein